MVVVAVVVADVIVAVVTYFAFVAVVADMSDMRFQQIRQHTDIGRPVQDVLALFGLC